jgi:hypothetical protein
MTTITRRFGPTGSSHEIDVRCSAILPHTGPDKGRCQLFVGHDGPHAVMFCHCGQRMVRNWTSNSPASAADAGPNALQRPWMYGYPMPAWFETESETPA